MSEEFRRLHHGGRPLLLPNAWDYATAAALAARGFPAVGTTSLGVAAAAGKPDGVAATRAETLDLARRLRGLPCLVSVDVEGGFSEDPAQVAELCDELAAAGAAGVNIEDGRAGGTLAPAAHVRDVIAAVKARVPGLFLNARTDTHWLRPATPDALAEAVRRVRAYVDAGADGVFVPGASDEDAITTLVSAVAAPVNVLFTPGRHTYARLAELGVRRISTGSLLFRAALDAVVRTATVVAEGGPIPADLPTYAEVQDLLPD